MTMRNGRLAIGLVLAGVACDRSNEKSGSFQTVGRQPDVAPVMLNKELPFRYPPALFAQKVQGNVTLRIYIDRNGQIVTDSTHVAETSGFSALDSAAVKGSRELKFMPATTQGQPVPVSILLPVFFRYPGAAPLPGDTVLKGRPPATNTAPPPASVAPKPVPPPVATRTVRPTARKAAAKRAPTKTTRTRARTTPTRKTRR